MPLRKRLLRKYNETELADDEVEAERRFDLKHPLKSERFESSTQSYLQRLDGNTISLRYIQSNGFDKPVLIDNKSGLDLRVPPPTFLVKDIRNYVGSSRVIDVMDVKTQKNIQMTMKEWCNYYESKTRDRILNVISLEFSHTGLDEFVIAPKVVRQLDWVDLVWPKHLKQSQIESTNSINHMKYPKVQKYCLMSVKGAYTDFHIDFGGTSVWYHILRGRKIFWMVPPTELNLQIFEEWTLSGQQHDVFFGDTVEECFRVELKAGQTFFIPSGWIHAVYTLEDSLVFGGNFLHSFGIEQQLKIAKLEDVTKVPVKFRYPFYTEMLWYVVQHYVSCLTGKSHLNNEMIAAAQNYISECSKTVKQNKEHNESCDDDEDTEIDENETESELNSSKRKRGRPPKNAKKVCQSNRKKQSKTNSKSKRKSDCHSDSETDIDEDAETKVKSQSSTCRMTKNSLSRLQYEADEPSVSHINQSISPSNKLSNKEKHNSKSKFSKTFEKDEENEMDILMDEPKLNNGWSNDIWSIKKTNGPQKIHLTTFELNGLKALIKHLSKLTGARKNMPALIKNSKSLLDDCKKMIIEHENDDPTFAVTGFPVTQDLKTAPKNDMDDLIAQFFKPDQETSSCSDAQTSTDAKQPSTSSNKYDNLNLLKSKKIKIEEKITPVEKKTAPTSTQKILKATLKETKCLSPMKKERMLSSSFVNANSASLNSPKKTVTSPQKEKNTAAQSVTSSKSHQQIEHREIPTKMISPTNRIKIETTKPTNQQPSQESTNIVTTIQPPLNLETCDHSKQASNVKNLAIKIKPQDNKVLNHSQHKHQKQISVDSSSQTTTETKKIESINKPDKSKNSSNAQTLLKPTSPQQKCLDSTKTTNEKPSKTQPPTKTLPKKMEPTVTSAGSGGTKPQSYIITSPFILNNMPGYTAPPYSAVPAFNQFARRPAPMLAAPILPQIHTMNGARFLLTPPATRIPFSQPNVAPSTSIDQTISKTVATQPASNPVVSGPMSMVTSSAASTTKPHSYILTSPFLYNNIAAYPGSPYAAALPTAFNQFTRPIGPLLGPPLSAPQIQTMNGARYLVAPHTPRFPINAHSQQQLAASNLSRFVNPSMHQILPNFPILPIPREIRPINSFVPGSIDSWTHTNRQADNTKRKIHQPATIIKH